MRRVIVALIGASTTLSVLTVAQMAIEEIRRPAPIFTSLDVRQQGREPVLVLSRTVERDTIADWRVVIWPADDGIGAAVCEGGGTSDYRLDEPPRVPMSVDWFTGDPGCWQRLVPGRVYAGAVTYTAAEGLPMVARFTVRR